MLRDVTQMLKSPCAVCYPILIFNAIGSDPHSHNLEQQAPLMRSRKRWDNRQKIAKNLEEIPLVKRHITFCNFFIWLSLKGTVKDPAVDPLRLSTLTDTKPVFNPYKVHNNPVILRWESSWGRVSSWGTENALYNLLKWDELLYEKLYI